MKVVKGVLYIVISPFFLVGVALHLLSRPFLFVWDKAFCYISVTLQDKEIDSSEDEKLSGECLRR